MLPPPRRFLLALIVLMMLPASQAVAQKPPQKTHPSSAATAKKTSSQAKRERDPLIIQIIKDVSPQRIQQTDEKLVSFGTQATLSVNNPDAATSSQGIVAGRNWINAEFERISAECNGCLEVKTDTFVEQPKGSGSRITQPT